MVKNIGPAAVGVTVGTVDRAVDAGMVDWVETATESVSIRRGDEERGTWPVGVELP